MHYFGATKVHLTIWNSNLQNLRLANDEITRLRDKDLKNLLCQKKLYLVLDLDHTLLNSSRFLDITVDEGYLKGSSDDLPGMTLLIYLLLLFWWCS